MKIINANAVIVPHNIPAYQFIEKVGRVAYKSEEKITEGSAVGFVKNMVKSEHWAVLEHEYVYVKCSDVNFLKNEKYLNHYNKYITGSFRAWAEIFNRASYTSNEMILLYKLYQILSAKYPEVFNFAFWDDMADDYSGDTIEVLSREEYIKAAEDEWGPEALFETLPHTILFTCDRGVTHELVRHRPCAFLQESTRYCSYDKGKFGHEIVVIKPCYLEDVEELLDRIPSGNDVKKIKGVLTGNARKAAYTVWKQTNKAAEDGYMKMTELGCPPQEARAVLPTSVKAEIFVTATEKEWQHIVNLRYHGTTGKPHPQMIEVMAVVYPDLKKATNERVQ